LVQRSIPRNRIIIPNHMISRIFTMFAITTDANMTSHRAIDSVHPDRRKKGIADFRKFLYLALPDFLQPAGEGCKLLNAK
jgi:hypothetical protein